MIGVLAPEKQHAAVREFFQLFKTQWDFYRADLGCDVLICATGEMPQNSATLVVVYHANESRESAVLRYGSDDLPIYRGCRFYDGEFWKEEISASGQTVVHLGYDLFAEVEHLLTQGQPREFARVPALELHIAILRDLLVRN